MLVSPVGTRQRQRLTGGVRGGRRGGRPRRAARPPRSASLARARSPAAEHGRPQQPPGTGDAVDPRGLGAGLAVLGVVTVIMTPRSSVPHGPSASVAVPPRRVTSAAICLRTSVQMSPLRGAAKTRSSTAPVRAREQHGDDLPAGLVDLQLQVETLAQGDHQAAEVDLAGPPSASSTSESSHGPGRARSAPRPAARAAAAVSSAPTSGWSLSDSSVGTSLSLLDRVLVRAGPPTSTNPPVEPYPPLPRRPPAVRRPRRTGPARPAGPPAGRSGRPGAARRVGAGRG